MEKIPTNKKQDNVNEAKQTQVKQQNKLTIEQEIAILKQDMAIITNKVNELIKNQNKILLLYQRDCYF